MFYQCTVQLMLDKMGMSVYSLAYLELVKLHSQPILKGGSSEMMNTAGEMVLFLI